MYAQHKYSIKCAEQYEYCTLYTVSPEQSRVELSGLQWWGLSDLHNPFIVNCAIQSWISKCCISKPTHQSVRCYILWSELYIVYCKLCVNDVYCILFIVHCEVYCILYIVHCKVYCLLYIVKCTLQGWISKCCISKPTDQSVCAHIQCNTSHIRWWTRLMMILKLQWICK